MKQESRISQIQPLIDAKKYIEANEIIQQLQSEGRNIEIYHTKSGIYVHVWFIDHETETRSKAQWVTENANKFKRLMIENKKSLT
jgi:hypothetical protein